MVVGSIPVWDIDGELKIPGKRAIEPRLGFGHFRPASRKTMKPAVKRRVRETMKKPVPMSNCRVILDLKCPACAPSTFVLSCDLAFDTNFAAGTESLEVKLFSEHEIPWDDIAFPTITSTLRFFFDDHKARQHGGRF